MYDMYELPPNRQKLLEVEGNTCPEEVAALDFLW